ncbi:MAG: proton-conducting transporter membrane subunit, partial [Candidatus Omnitrophota bacterium]
MLARIAKDTFVLDAQAKTILFILGSITIVCAVMMALIQHNIRRLLGYHAVSQVGYMVLGIACATPLGLAAGLFHMINHALYKSCLFLDSGNISTQAGSSELDELGGLAKYMPVTFVTMLIAAFSISGIPPFNGFVSKWLIYQSLLEFSGSLTSLPLKCAVIFSLVAALIGSGLTLASFLKVISSVFFGIPKKEIKEARAMLLITPVILSTLCVVFGVFAFQTVLAYLHTMGQFSVTGLWQPSLATTLIVAGILMGLILFKFNPKATRSSPTFIGGEVLRHEEELKIGDFYATIKELPVLKLLFSAAENKVFDIYDVTKKALSAPIAVLRYLHNGVLPTYLAWCLIGAIGLFVIFFR